MNAILLADKFMEAKCTADLATMLLWMDVENNCHSVEQSTTADQGISVQDIRSLNQQQADALLQIMDKISRVLQALEHHPELDVVYPASHWHKLRIMDAAIRSWSYVLSKIRTGTPFDLEYAIMRQMFCNTSIAINYHKAFRPKK